MAKRKSYSKTAKARRIKRKQQRFYGRKTVKKGTKATWLSVQNKHGWSLGLAFGKRTIWLRNVRFETQKDVHNALAGDRRQVVYISLKGSK